MVGTIPKSATKVLLFFYICNSFCIFLHFFCTFLHPRLIPPHPIHPKINPSTSPNPSPHGVGRVGIVGCNPCGAPSLRSPHRRAECSRKLPLRVQVSSAIPSHPLRSRAGGLPPLSLRSAIAPILSPLAAARPSLNPSALATLRGMRRRRAIPSQWALRCPLFRASPCASSGARGSRPLRGLARSFAALLRSRSPLSTRTARTFARSWPHAAAFVPPVGVPSPLPSVFLPCRSLAVVGIGSLAVALLSGSWFDYLCGSVFLLLALIFGGDIWFLKTSAKR